MDRAEQDRLTAFLRLRVNPGAELRAPSEGGDDDDQDSAELWIDGAKRGWVRKDDEDPSDISYSVGFAFKAPPTVAEAEERLRDSLNPKVALKQRKAMGGGRTQIDDSLELYIDGEFMGLLYKDETAGGFQEYTVEIQILPEDLDETD